MPLDQATALTMGSRFGFDFSNVLIREDARTARSVNAAAFTVGNRIVFDSGRYQPGTRAGDLLIAHELAHVVQQARGGAAVPALVHGVNERAADRAAREAISGIGPVRVDGRSAPGLARQPRSLTETLVPSHLTNDELAREISLIRQWLSENPPGSPDYAAMRATLERLEAEVARPSPGVAEHAAPPAPRAAATTVQAPAASAPAPPRALISSYDPASLSEAGRNEEELLIQQWSESGAGTPEERAHLSATLAAIQADAAMRRRYTWSIGGAHVTDATASESLNALQGLARAIRSQLTSDVSRHEAQAELRAEHYVVGAVSDFLADPLRGGIELPPASVWNEPLRLLHKAGVQIRAGRADEAASSLRRAHELWRAAHQQLYAYIDGTISGAERAVTGLEVTRDVSFVTVGVLATVTTGGAAGALISTGYTTGANIAGQATEVHLGLRDSIDWAGISFDAALGLITSYIGGRLGNAITNQALGQPALASLGRQAVSHLVGNVLSGRASSILHQAARTVFDNWRGFGAHVTGEQFLEQVVHDLTSRRVFWDILMDAASGEASRRFAAGAPPTRPGGGPAHASETPPRAATPAPSAHEPITAVRPIERGVAATPELSRPSGPAPTGQSDVTPLPARRTAGGEATSATGRTGEVIPIERARGAASRRGAADPEAAATPRDVVQEHADNVVSLEQVRAYSAAQQQLAATGTGDATPSGVATAPRAVASSGGDGGPPRIAAPRGESAVREIAGHSMSGAATTGPRSRAPRASEPSGEPRMHAGASASAEGVVVHPERPAPEVIRRGGAGRSTSHPPEPHSGATGEGGPRQGARGFQGPGALELDQPSLWEETASRVNALQPGHAEPLAPRTGQRRGRTAEPAEPLDVVEHMERGGSLAEEPETPQHAGVPEGHQVPRNEWQKYAHDMGVEHGGAAAQRGGLKPNDPLTGTPWMNPLEPAGAVPLSGRLTPIGPFGRGVDAIMFRTDGSPVPLEYKGGRRPTDPAVRAAQVHEWASARDRRWMRTKIRELEQLGDPMAGRLRAQLERGELTLRLYATDLSPTGEVIGTELVETIRYPRR